MNPFWTELLSRFPLLDEILIGSAVFTGLVLLLTAGIVIARRLLVPAAEVTLVINGKREIQVPVGAKLMYLLLDGGIPIPSACGGRGICGECRVRIVEDPPPPLPVDIDKLGPLVKEGWRLSCQLPVKRPLKLWVPEEVLGAQSWIARVGRNRNLTPLIKELLLELPSEPKLQFRAGQYMLLEASPKEIDFRDFEIDPPFREEWDRFDWWHYRVVVDEPTQRAYSLANAPFERSPIETPEDLERFWREGFSEDGKQIAMFSDGAHRFPDRAPGEDGKQIAMFNIRLALPPPGSDLPPGKVSSFVWSLKRGDRVRLTGPFGSFYVRDRDREMIFVGGGAGMAPLRSMILDELLRKKTRRKISYWYGARSLRELFYRELFEKLAASYENFSYHVALSEPRPEDRWEGPVGFIHQVLYQLYLKDHPAPEECDYYLCGPPPMLNAMLEMLDQLGVEEENIFFDKFE